MYRRIVRRFHDDAADVRKTDLFAGAVAHAGISSISSYWGEGYWGYLLQRGGHCRVRSRGTAPTSTLIRAPSSSADQVPRADPADPRRRPTPTSPKGESDAFYIALKLLGKQVEYVQVEGTDHWVVDHDKRLVWSNTILAWFDRWLKDQPGWWDDLYTDEE